MPIILYELLLLLTPQIMSVMNNDTTSVSDVNSNRVSANKTRDTQQFYKLFPELISHNVAITADKIDTIGTSAPGVDMTNSDNNSNSKVHSTSHSMLFSPQTVDGDTNNSSRYDNTVKTDDNNNSNHEVGHKIVSIHNLYTSCLEALISITNNNEVACHALSSYHNNNSDINKMNRNGSKNSTSSNNDSQNDSQQYDSQLLNSQTSITSPDRKVGFSYGKKHNSNSTNVITSPLQSLSQTDTNSSHNLFNSGDNSVDNCSVVIEYLVSLLCYYVSWRYILVLCKDQRQHESSVHNNTSEDVNNLMVSVQGALSLNETFIEVSVICVIDFFGIFFAYYLYLSN